jgi:hypothetical protein
MKRTETKIVGLGVTLLLVLWSVPPGQAQSNDWNTDLSMYMIGASMKGDVTVRGRTAELDVGFSEILENLQLGGMGRMRVDNGQWSVALDLIYMGLGASREVVRGDVDQWMVEPTVGYRLSPKFEVLAGVRYNRIDAAIQFLGPMETRLTAEEDWWDPIVGGRLRLQVSEKWSFEPRFDIGGFGVGSDFSWQIDPVVNWRVSRRASLQASYRFLQNDYSTGSGASQFRYDVLTSGPQLGLTFHF